ncbi:uncharacterized protein PAN0_007c3238 [Moesziomyces antarcticus]|uniref:Uncharacterized protein n=1 Tax=Pseudozyma antarctica TaxID=84753 RepID=A0A081CEC6_PSEA2|nr:uncharacterized protein PAN0_007c3238 [Moesziomyces antarcticus]GAK65022.1 hypothetical protein PAN0_007c3238 [Moesziomyces antarcticus]
MPAKPLRLAVAKNWLRGTGWYMGGLPLQCKSPTTDQSQAEVGSERQMARPEDPNYECVGIPVQILSALQDRLTRDDSKLDEAPGDSVPVLDMACTRGKQM